MKSIYDTEYIKIQNISLDCRDKHLIKLSIKKPGFNQRFINKTYNICNFKAFNLDKLKYIDCSELYFANCSFCDYVYYNSKLLRYLNLKNINQSLIGFGVFKYKYIYKYLNIENIKIINFHIISKTFKCTYYTANKHFHTDYKIKFYIPMLKIC